MGKTIQVTSAQVNAARLWIERADRDGTEVPEAIRKLAEARPRPIIGDAPLATGASGSPGGHTTAPDPPAADQDAMHRPDDLRVGEGRAPAVPDR